MPCEICCEKDDAGNYVNELPCCWNSFCVASATTEDISLCICCGAEMFKEDGCWYHHSQRDTPIKDRGKAQGAE